MIRSRLQDYRGEDPTWGFVAQLGAEQFTGEVLLGTTPRVRLFVDEGAVYFAEREGDAPVQSRLVVRGALTPAQLARGGVFSDGAVSLARLFTRDSSIDRADVEHALERLTQEVLDEVGPLPVGVVELTPLRHHDTGIHEWARRVQPPVVRSAPATAEPFTPVRPTPPVAPITIAPPVVTAPAPAPAPAPPAVDPAAVTPPPAAPQMPPPVGDTASPFMAPPVIATAASLPAPPAAAAADAAPPQPTIADDAPTLPRLASRVMSVAEITAAHAVITGETVAPEVVDRYTPTDFSTMELPQLATKVTSVSELTAHVSAEDDEPSPEEHGEAAPIEQVVADANGEVALDSGRVPAISAAPMPALPALHLSSPNQVAEPTPHADLSDQVDVVDQIDDERDTMTAIDESSAEPIAPWATPAQNMAASEIWQMVDTMLAPAPSDDDLVVTGGPPEHRSGRRRRSRKA